MTDALVAAIRAASGGNELPARIGTTADDLASLAASRCEANPALADLCNALHSGRDDAVCDGDGHGFGDDDAKVIAFFLARSRTARSLDLDRNHIGDGGAAALAEALKENASLTELRLWGNRISDEGAKAIAASLKPDSALRVLLLHDNHVTAEGEAAISGAGGPRLCALVTLDGEMSGAVAADGRTEVKEESERGAAGEVNPARLLADIRKLATFGARRTGGVSRPQYSKWDSAAREWLSRRVAQAGLAYREDAAGNAFVRLQAGQSAQGDRTLWLGSHLDSVPNGGALDGALGVLTAVEALRALKESGVPLTHSVEAVAFADEEGAYGGFFGSRAAVAGVSPEDVASVRGRDGDTLAGAMQGAGFDPGRVAEAQVDASRLAGYLELHIEQGAVLADAGMPIGVVTAIAGVLRVAVTFSGRADHAGTTPMYMRQDAARGLGHLLARVHTLPAAVGAPDAVITCGRMTIEPGADNIVPARAVAYFDVRDRDADAIAAIEAQLQQWAEAAAAEHGLRCACSREKYTAPVPLDDSMQAAVAAAADGLGLEHRAMPSGAGHDAQIVATKVPAGMVFVPSIEGRSHSPLERTEWPHILAGARVLHHAARGLVTDV